MILPIEPYLQPLSPDQRIKLEAYVEQFCQQDDAHLLFAAHAAFPAVLTADLLYKLWTNFRSNELGTLLEWPATLVSDLLLSPLCQSIGRHIFEIPNSIRGALQAYLTAHPLYGTKRLDRLAHFLKFYLQENPHKIPSPAFLQAQEFIYQARLEPQKALESVVETWNNSTHLSEVQHLIDQVEMLDNLYATQEDSSLHKMSKTRLSAAAKLFKSIQDYQRGQPEKALAWFQNFQGQIQEQASKGGIKINLDHHLIEKLPEDLVTKDERPVFLGVFSDFASNMPGVLAEKNQIQEIFKEIPQLNLVLLHNPSKEYFHYNLNRFRHSICIFHYAGDFREGLYKDDPSENPQDELADILKTIPNLRFIFLNDGDSSNCVNSLIDSNLNAVILASKTGKISDDDAAFFAVNFYKKVAKDSPISTSYKDAVSALETKLAETEPQETWRRMGPKHSPFEDEANSVEGNWALHANNAWRLSDTIGSLLPDSFEAVEAKKSAYPHHLNAIPLLDNPKDCIGRTDVINHLHSLLQNSTLLVVSGEAGVGKTTVLRAYLTEYQKEFKHVIWVDYQTDLAQSFANDSHLNNLIDSSEPYTLIEDTFLAKITETLNSISGPNLLIIDYSHAPLTNQNIHNLLPVGNRWISVLICRESTHHYDTFILNELTSESALQLFKNFYTSGEDKEVKDLLRKINHIPLKIKLIAQFLARFQGKLSIQNLLSLEEINFDSIAQYLLYSKDNGFIDDQIITWLSLGNDEELIKGVVIDYLDKHAKNKEAGMVISTWLDKSGDSEIVRRPIKIYLEEHVTESENYLLIMNWIDATTDVSWIEEDIITYAKLFSKTPEGINLRNYWNDLKSPKASPLISTLIKRDRFRDALFVLEQLAPKHLENDVILLYSRITNLENQVRNGVISNENASIETARIRSAILAIYDTSGVQDLYFTEPVPNIEPLEESLIVPRGSDGLIKILFLTANPNDQNNLALNRQANLVQMEAQGKALYIRVCPHIERESMIDMVAFEKPQIVHFSGHSQDGSLAIIDPSTNKAARVEDTDLIEIFTLFKKVGVKCVVLCSCWSFGQAKVISELKLPVVCMLKKIGDEDAILFSRDLYYLLVSNNPLEIIFDFAKAKLSKSSRETPSLWYNGKRIA